MKRLILLIVILSTWLSACNFKSPTPAVTSTPTTAPSATPRPASTLTAVPLEVTLHVKSELINCRFGPGTAYVLLNELHRDQFARVAGRNDSSTWLYIRDPGNPGGFCWVSADVVEAQGQVDQLPVTLPPFVTVTDVSLRVEPSRIVVNCSQFPQTVFFEAQVTANGPTLLTWRWEASTGVSSNDGTLIFEEAGTQVINDYYQIGAPNDYWVKLHVLTPNEMVEQVNFPVSCTP
ncbi:MAG: hypothetical protein HY863_03050 [Chloroflexi bacterium]|nr:hypothetical protein [Chloroflexota bacterium]